MGPYHQRLANSIRTKKKKKKGSRGVMEKSQKHKYNRDHQPPAHPRKAPCKCLVCARPVPKMLLPVFPNRSLQLLDVAGCVFPDFVGSDLVSLFGAASVVDLVVEISVWLTAKDWQLSAR
jgi:hypothetical protein